MTAGRPVKAVISSAVGPDTTNSRPARPSSSQLTSDGALPACIGSAGAGNCGSTSASSVLNEASAARMKPRSSTSFTSDMKRRTATTAPIRIETRSGT